MMSLQMKTYKQTWELDPPFIIAGEVWSSVDSLIVELVDDFGRTGRSETQGVSYRGETYSSLAAEVEALRGEASAGMSRETLQALLPAGGARNALDVALWDLQAQQTGQPLNKLLGLGRLKTVQTVLTLGIMSGDEAATIAGRASAFGQLKLKVDGGRHIEMIAAVREARPDARIIVDANQSWSFQLMKELMPELERLHVDVLEQPLPVGGDDELEGFISPILLMADESCQDTGDLPTVRQRYGGVNIKLDKAGGLTEAMKMSNEARSLGLKTMVGNMCGGSLAMAPAFLVAQSTDYVDLDGPLLQTSDWENGFCYQGERMFPSDRPLWGKLNSAV